MESGQAAGEAFMSRDNGKSKKQSNTARHKGAAAGIPPKIISQMLEDQFGGRKLKKHGKSSMQAIQKQVDELEKILKSKD
jgi:hypothetical protein